jgi:hypothetical protein
MNKNIWFAIVRLEPVNGNPNLGDAIGAHVNVAYRALNKKDFLIIVAEHFKSVDLKVIKVDYIERGDKLSIGNPKKAEKLILLKRILDDSDEFAWGTFYTYRRIE